MRSETYVGPWLPEPLMTDPTPGPAERADLAESVSLAFLTLLESLSPTERAAFRLHEVFDYQYAAVAAILGKSQANCRQMASRVNNGIESPQIIGLNCPLIIA